MTDNEIIHTKLFDGHWCKDVTIKLGWAYCVECGSAQTSPVATNPDYTSDAGQGAILRVMGERGLWEKAFRWYGKTYLIASPLAAASFLRRSPTERNRLLAQFLTEVM